MTRETKDATQIGKFVYWKGVGGENPRVFVYNPQAEINAHNHGLHVEPLGVYDDGSVRLAGMPYGMPRNSLPKGLVAGLRVFDSRDRSIWHRSFSKICYGLEKIVFWHRYR